MTRLLFLLLAVCFLSPVGSGTVQGELLEEAGRVTFLKGEVTVSTAAEPKLIKAGETIGLGRVVKTGSNAKVKIMLPVSKTLITIMPNTKVRFTEQGAELVEGPQANLVVKKLKQLNPNPKLQERSTHLGGTFVLRTKPPKAEPLNLMGTFCRETRPAFRWKSRVQGKILVSLYRIDEPGPSQLLWESVTSDSSMTYPEGEPDLEQGKVYYWELKTELPGGREFFNSAKFYVLSTEEKKSYEMEIEQLALLAGVEEVDDFTLDFLKLELLNKYNLKDDLKLMVKDLLNKYPGDKYLQRLTNEL